MELLLPKMGCELLGNKQQFTFQYGATSTLNVLKQILPLKTFTFQYGATSTIMQKYY